MAIAGIACLSPEKGRLLRTAQLSQDQHEFFKAVKAGWGNMDDMRVFFCSNSEVLVTVPDKGVAASGILNAIFTALIVKTEAWVSGAFVFPKSLVDIRISPCRVFLCSVLGL